MPDKIKSVKLSTGKKKMMVIWKKEDIATGYQITHATNKQFTKGKHSKNTNNNKTVKRTIKKLKFKERYYVGVRAYRKVKGKIVYGPYSLIRTGRVK